MSLCYQQYLVFSKWYIHLPSKDDDDDGDDDNDDDDDDNDDDDDDDDDIHVQKRIEEHWENHVIRE